MTTSSSLVVAVVGEGTIDECADFVGSFSEVPSLRGLTVVQTLENEEVVDLVFFAGTGVADCSEVDWYIRRRLVLLLLVELKTEYQKVKK